MALSQDNRQLILRLHVLRLVIVLIFLAAVLKLWHLTVVKYEFYSSQAERNQLKTVPLVAPRGFIFDRDHQVLVENVHSFNLFLYRDRSNSLESTIRFLKEDLGLDSELLDERMMEARNTPAFRPILIKEDVQLEELTYVLAHQAEYPELEFLEQPKRRYRQKELAAHLLGFVGEISQSELEMKEFGDSNLGDIVGKAGLERKYNGVLSGSDGHREVLVTSTGKMLEEVSRIPAKEGAEFDLTIDLDLQRVAEEQLGDLPGAIFAFDPRTGEVLVLASKPSFDPNIFVSRISSRQWQELVENADHPLQNRVIQNAFSPGSIFKVVMALAGLELGLIDENRSVYCNGAVEIYGNVFHCHLAGGHGRVRLREAIQYSCNIYFYELGKEMGIDQIARFSRMVGLGELTGMDLPGEIRGLVPSPEWKRQVQGQPWYAGETISVSIGQGALNVTPAQLARAIGIIATGKAPRLHLNKGSRPDAPGLGEGRLGFSPQNIALIREAMWSVVNQGGTGAGALTRGFDVCGKTGTAQMVSRAVYSRLSEEDKKRFQPNAWFVGFAPRDNPEIVIAVIVQRGGSGSRSAAPLAGKVLQAYYEKYKKNATQPIQLASLTEQQ